MCHSLATMRDWDRIRGYEGGKIIEDGTYDELIEQNGFFAELVERQRLDRDSEKEAEPEAEPEVNPEAEPAAA